MESGTQAHQPTLLNGQRTYIPIAFAITIIVMVAGGILWITGMFDAQRQEREEKFLPRTEFQATIEPIKSDVAETNENVKDLQKSFNKFLETQQK